MAREAGAAHPPTSRAPDPYWRVGDWRGRLPPLTHLPVGKTPLVGVLPYYSVGRTQLPLSHKLTPSSLPPYSMFMTEVTSMVGPNGECSEDLHELLNTMAESKTQYQARTAGELESEWKTASNLTYLRRQLSVCIVTGVAESLLTRLQQAGNAGRGARQAAQRRAMAMGREERGRRERATHWLLHTRGYRVLQRGQFLNQ